MIMKIYDHLNNKARTIFFQIGSSGQTILIVQLCVFNVVKRLAGRKIRPEIDCPDDRFFV